MDFIIETFALIATMPIISFFFIYYLLSFSLKEKKKAFNVTINITSILFFTAVAGQINYIFQSEFGLLFSFLILIFILFMIGFLQWKVKGKFNYKRMFNGTSKLGFVSFGFLYIVFFIMGLFYT